MTKKITDTATLNEKLRKHNRDDIAGMAGWRNRLRTELEIGRSPRMDGITADRNALALAFLKQKYGPTWESPSMA